VQQRSQCHVLATKDDLKISGYPDGLKDKHLIGDSEVIVTADKGVQAVIEIQARPSEARNKPGQFF